MASWPLLRSRRDLSPSSCVYESLKPASRTLPISYWRSPSASVARRYLRTRCLTCTGSESTSRNSRSLRAPSAASRTWRRDVPAGLGSTTSRSTKQSAALLCTALANSTVYYLTVLRVASARLLLPRRSLPMNGRLAYCWSDWVVLRACEESNHAPACVRCACAS